MTLILFLSHSSAQAAADDRVYKLKAGFLYNFIKIIEWPQASVDDSSDPWVIGIVGKDPFSTHFDNITAKPIKGRTVVIKRYPTMADVHRGLEISQEQPSPDAARVTGCHVLFICDVKKADLLKIIEIVKGYPVLTVGETKGFLKAGGLVNFLTSKKTSGFEINHTMAKKVKIVISSKLLRMAKKVI